MLAFFHSLGKYSLSREFLKKIASGFEIEEAHIFIIWIDIPSCPLALLGSNGLIMFAISPEQISKSRQSFLDLKTDICWDRTVVVYYCTLLTKVIIKQICFYKKIRDKLITCYQRRYQWNLSTIYKCFQYFPIGFWGYFRIVKFIRKRL